MFLLLLLAATPDLFFANCLLFSIKTNTSFCRHAERSPRWPDAKVYDCSLSKLDQSPTRTGRNDGYRAVSFRKLTLLRDNLRKGKRRG